MANVAKEMMPGPMGYLLNLHVIGGEYRQGRPLSSIGLARLLKRFGVQPGTIRLSDGRTPKGYKRESLSEAFRRYLPPSEAATTPHPSNDGGSVASPKRHTSDDVADPEGPETPADPDLWRCGGSDDPPEGPCGDPEPDQGVI